MWVRGLTRSLLGCLVIGVIAMTVAACGSSKKTSGTTAATSSGSPANAANAATPDAALGTALFGTLPPTGTPTHGGTITQGQLTGETPTYIMPIVPSGNVTTGTESFVGELYMPLYDGPTGALPKIDYANSAAAGPPVASDGDKTYTVHLRSGLTWSDGKPITADDVLFFYDVLRAGVKQAAANWGQYTPGQFPMSVTSASAPNATTIVFHLNRAYNPGFFLENQLQVTDNVFPMPSTVWNVDSAHGPHLTDWQKPAVALKIYNYLNSQGKSVATFASNPLWKVVSGPFKLQSFSATNSSYVLTPNPSFAGSPKPYASQIDTDTYTSFTSELDALRAGSLDIMVGFDPSQLGEVGSLKSQGIDVYGVPGWGWFGGQINYEDTTDDFNKVISQLYVRQAIAHLIDQPAIVKGVYKGDAVTAFGPVASYPKSQYSPSDAAVNPYPYSPSAAVALLKAHGWKVVPNGQTTCVKAGAAAGECGAGIPAGTPLKFVWANVPESVSSTGPLESEAVASIAKQAAGINIELVTKAFNFLTSEWTDSNPAGDKNHNDWGVNNYGGLSADFYPTSNGTLNAPHTGFNTGSYDTPQGNKLINASVFSGNPTAVKTEATFFEHDVPNFYFPEQVYLLAVNTKKVGGAAAGWTVMSYQQWEPQYWYQVK